MKKATLTSILASLLLFAGCATTVSLPDRLDKFVEKTELEYKNYTDDDWKKSRDEYDALVTEMKKDYDSYSTTEKVRMMKAMGRYGALTVENEVSEASGTIGDILESIPKTINDMIENIDTAAVRASVDSIKGSINDIIESIDTARLRKAVEGLTQNIDTAKLREKLEGLAKIFGLEE